MELWICIGGFVILFVTIFILSKKEKERKRLDPNYRPADLWMLFIRALPKLFYWGALYGALWGVPVLMESTGERTLVAQLFVCLGFLWLGRILALLQELVDKTGYQQRNSVV